jgi:hypothetical protein
MSLVEWIGAWPGAVFLRDTGTAYLLVNAAHILGVGLLIGAILPLDLRLLGFFRRAPLGVLAPFLSRAAAVGLVLAIVTGLWLFSVKPGEYMENSAFLLKVGLLVAALANVALQHGNHRFATAVARGDPSPVVRLVALCSILLWLSVLVAGRWIGFL